MSNEPRWSEEILSLRGLDNHQLQQMAAIEREKNSDNSVELCAIYNAKSGKCSEDCVFCAQSAHYRTNVMVSDIPGVDSVLSYAEMVQSYGVKHFSMVTSGKGISDKDLERLLIIYRKLQEQTELSLCASLGIINLEQAKKLKDGGVTRYHHNLEAGEHYFPKVCTTHTYKERLNTIKNAQKAGLEICSGGMMGLGESLEDRIELALILKKLSVESIPINVLMPVKGTPMQNNAIMTDADFLRTVALFRYINPEATIRFAGGRTLFNIKTQMQSLKCGFNGMMVGNYLTREGMEIKSDINRLEKHGFKIVK
jgi:biotin synthase